MYGMSTGATLLRTGWGAIGTFHLFLGLFFGRWALDSRRNFALLAQTLAILTVVTAALVFLTQFARVQLIDARVQAVEAAVVGWAADRVVVSSAEVTLAVFLFVTTTFLAKGSWPKWGRLVVLASMFLLYATFTRNLLVTSAFAVVIATLLLEAAVGSLPSLG